jgi:phytoene synthase
MDGALRDAYETCRLMQRRRDPTYYWATRRLPSEVRPGTHALYGYVRTADDIVDGPHRPATAAERLAALDAWQAELERPTHPVASALLHAAQRHSLPLGELEKYMCSMRIDCAPVRMATWAELEDYMDGSAGSVGRIMGTLLGLPARVHSRLGRLGLAFQLTNFLRDIAIDRRLDRIYLPAEDRERFGVSEADLEASRTSPELRALVGHHVARARELFAEGEEAIAAAPPAVRRGMRLACAVYGRVLEKAERQPHAPTLRAGDMVVIAARAVRR